MKGSLFISEEQTPLVFGWGSLHSTHTQRRACRGAQLPAANPDPSLACKELSVGLTVDLVVQQHGVCSG